MDWTNSSVLKLIGEYEKRPVLWDSNHELYRVYTAKYEAWQSFAAAFQCEVSDIRKKLNSLLASYRRERQKVRTGGKSTWFAYNALIFLPKHIDNNGDSIAEVGNSRHFY